MSKPIVVPSDKLEWLMDVIGSSRNVFQSNSAAIAAELMAEVPTQSPLEEQCNLAVEWIAETLEKQGASGTS